jgi:hypothetical protein
MMMLNRRLLGCSCICSSRVLKPLGGKISLEEDNGIPGSLFFVGHPINYCAIFWFQAANCEGDG